MRQVGQLYDFLATLFLEITSKDDPEKNIAIFYGFFMDDIDLANKFLHSLRGLMVRNNVSESYIPSETWSEPFNSMLAFPCLQPQWSMSDVHDVPLSKSIQILQTISMKNFMKLVSFHLFGPNPLTAIKFLTKLKYK